MNRREHLLWILAEECAEVAQRASKAARFGLYEVQPGQDKNNSERLRKEINDLLAATEMLDADGALPLTVFRQQDVSGKVAQVEKYLEYSKRQGTLS